MQNQYNLAAYLSQCHELWEQADVFVDKFQCESETIFLINNRTNLEPVLCIRNFLSNPDPTFLEISDPDPTQLLSKEAKVKF